MRAPVIAALFSILGLALSSGISACGDAGSPSSSSPDAETGSEEDAGEADGDSTATEDADTAGSTGEDADGSCPGGAKSCVDENGLNSPALCADQPDTLCEDGCCIPLFKCKEDADCAQFSGLTGQGDIADCEDERFACACDPANGSCYLFVCNSSNDCDSEEICANGICAAAPDPADLQVRVLSRDVVLRAGASATLHAAAFHPDDPSVLMADTAFEWEVADSTLASMDGDTLTAGDNAGTTTVVARVVGATVWSAPLAVTNTGAPEEGAIRIVLIDGHGGGLLKSTARFRVNGANASTESETTTGVLDIPDVGLPMDVHAFVEGHHHLSIFGWNGLEMQLAPATRFDVELHVDSDGTLDPATQIFSGAGEVIHGAPNLEHYAKPGEIEAAITSLALGEGLLAFDLPQLLGPNVSRFWDPEAPPGIFDSEEEQELPGGVTFSIGFPVITDYWLAARPGDIAMWSLGGRVGLGDAGVGQKIGQIIASVSGGDSVDVQEIISTLLPLFQDFYSGVKVITIGDTPDFETPTEVDIALSLPLTNRVSMNLPSLPTLGAPDAWTDTVVVLGGSLDELGRFTPLGITAGTDAITPGGDLDGEVDGDVSTPEKDPFSLAMAAAHSGIQTDGATHAIIAFAASLDESGEGLPEAGSGMITRFTLPDAGPNPWTSVDETPETFLAIPIGSSFHAEEGRILSVTPVEGTDLQRIHLEGGEGEPEWHVYLPPGIDSVTLPIPPEGVTDSAATSTRILVNAFDLIEGVPLEHLFTSGGVPVEELLSAVERASYIREKTSTE
jgi:hypothetical protein